MVKKVVKAEVVRTGRCATGSCLGEKTLINAVAKNTSLRFIVHKHQSRQVHYDMRILNDNVLVSWVLPKGPSIDPHVKRLAIRTPNHKLEYEQFEGMIPEGEYGAGVVMVWDKGVYYNIKMHAGELVPIDACLEAGHMELFFKGTKLYGAFSLIRMQGHHDHWLFVKMKDEYATVVDITRSIKASKSALTGRTMAQIKKDSET